MDQHLGLNRAMISTIGAESFSPGMAEFGMKGGIGQNLSLEWGYREMQSKASLK